MSEFAIDVIDDSAIVHPPWEPDLPLDDKWVELDEDKLAKVVGRLAASVSRYRESYPAPHTGLPGVWGGSAPRAGGATTATHSEAPAGKFVRMRDKYLSKKYAAFVTTYTAAEYEEMKAKTYLSASGKSGFVLKPDGDIISVFSAPSSGEGYGAMLEAIRQGGTKLDCFDGFLADEFYPDFGFKEYDTLAWDAKYAPAGWDNGKFNTPDIVFMRLNNGD